MGTALANRENTPHELIRTLRARGIATARELCQDLGISQATFSRAIRDSANEILTLGRGRATRYAIPRLIPGVPREIPIFEVNDQGVAQRTGTLNPLHGGAFWVERSGRGEVHEGMPFFVADMRPQGFLGRAFARTHPDLGLPERITDWNDDHVIRALTDRGDDTVGNVIIGEGELQRFIASSAKARQPVPLVNQGQAFDALAQAATEGQLAGSSAGGDRPKFTTYAETAHGPAQVLVKFSPPFASDMGQRWSNLLVCEAIAAEVLNEAGVMAARAGIVMSGQRTHLTVDRFDRIGERGRRALISLGAIDDHRFGNRDNYTSAAARFERAGMISSEDAETMRLIHCFGVLIGNTDMHFGNLSFFVAGVADP